MQQADQACGTQPLRSAAEGEALVIATMQAHADVLLRVARRHSLCDDDAADAYQRALEIFLRHVRRLDQDTAHRWLFRVVRHEAMTVRDQRQRTLGAVAIEPDLAEARTVESPEDHVLRVEDMAHAAEALSTLKAAEVQALWLQASDNTYAQIAERSGWTRTKVNRVLVEGRRRFVTQREAIDSGQECERWRPVLLALVEGRATAGQLTDVRPHLRNCRSCQAHVRGLHRAGAQVAAVAPVGLIAGPLAQTQAGRLAGWLMRVHDAVGAQLQERLTLQVVKVQAAADALSAGKLAAVAASAAAIAGGGAAVVQTRESSPAVPASASETTKGVTTERRAVPASARPSLSPVAREGGAVHTGSAVGGPAAARPGTRATGRARRARRPTEFAVRAADAGPVAFFRAGASKSDPALRNERQAFAARRFPAAGGGAEFGARRPVTAAAAGGGLFTPPPAADPAGGEFRP